MIKILFICHGNICRSPIAEFILKKLVSDAGLSKSFEIASAATSTEEIGNDIYPPAKAILKTHGIPFSHRRARQVTGSDMRYYDFVIIMDDNNARNLRRMFGADAMAKVSRMMSYAGEERDVSDPWYTDNFERSYRDIYAGCVGLLKELLRDHSEKL